MRLQWQSRSFQIILQTPKSLLQPTQRNLWHLHTINLWKGRSVLLSLHSLLTSSWVGDYLFDPSVILSPKCALSSRLLHVTILTPEDDRKLSSGNYFRDTWEYVLPIQLQYAIFTQTVKPSTLTPSVRCFGSFIIWLRSRRYSVTSEVGITFSLI